MKTARRTGWWHGRFVRPVVVALGLVCWALGALAQEGPVKVGAADFAPLQKLRYASALAHARGMFAHTAPAKAAVQAQWEQALKDAGWTDDRFREADGALAEAIRALADVEKGGEDAEGAAENLKAMDATTVATAKAKRGDYTPWEELEEKASKQVRDEAEAERRGAPPEAKQLEGKWVYDLEASLDLVAPASDETRNKLRAKLEPLMTGASYTFGPGDKIVSVKMEDGAPRTDTGTYRLEGGQVFFKAENRKREQSLAIGMKNGQLRLGMMGIYSVFRKE